MKFGLIGYPLIHSFSKKYFEEKFQKLGLTRFEYDNYPLQKIEDIVPLLDSDLFGLNITIPYKTATITYLNDIDHHALQIGAVNSLVRTGQYSWKGYNTDFLGFTLSLIQWMNNHELPGKALILGTGGAAKAIQYALAGLDIRSSLVSRDSKGDYSYRQLTVDVMKSHPLIINTTPLGMYPDTMTCPAIPYEAITANHWLYDVVYNPVNTLFLTRGAEMGAHTKNGLDMLHLQAEQAWLIWKTYGNF